jgi:hypothetical protein
VSGNRVKRLFGPKRDEETEEWRKVHGEIWTLHQILLRRSNQGGLDREGM